jgi:hypothetical protein
MLNTSQPDGLNWELDFSLISCSQSPSSLYSSSLSESSLFYFYRWGLI